MARTKQRRGKEYAIKGIILDLDDTLYDCYGQVSKKAFKKADKAMAKILDEPVSVVSDLRKPLVQKGMDFREQNKLICHELGVSKKLVKEACALANDEYYLKASITGIKLFPGVPALLKKLRKHHKLALVTWGRLELQQAKIDKLKLKPYFDVLMIDEWKELKATKADSFLSVMKRFKLKPEELVVIGDKPENEISIGNKMGMATIRVMQGKYQKYVPKNDFERADFKVKKVTDIGKILELL